MKSSMVRGSLAAAWLICAGFLAFRDWDPTTHHYLTLFFREAPFFFFDIFAAFQRLFTSGLCQLGYVLVLLLAAAGAGRLALSPCSLTLPRLTRFILELALGLALLGYMTFALGVLQLYTAAGLMVALAVLGSCVAAALWPLRHISSVRRQIRCNWADAGLLLCAGIMAVFLLSKALWPAVHVDAISYHLGIPNYYLQEGALRYIPTDMYSGFPFFTEMLYVLAMLAEGQKSAQCTSVLFLFLSGLCIYGFMEEAAGKRSARIAALLFLVTPCFMESSVNSGNDISIVFYVLMTAGCFFVWRSRGRPTALLVLTGIFAGTCLSIKYTALTFMPLVLAAALIGDEMCRKQRSGSLLFKRSFICAASALMVFLPWCLKNFLATGNPFYPALYPFLGGADMSREMYEVSKGLAYAADMGNVFSAAAHNFQNVFLCTPNWFRICGTLGNAGLGLLFFFPVLFLLRSIPSVIKALCCAAGLFFLTWTLFSGIIRFFYPGIALLLIVSAYALVAAVEQLPRVFKPFIILAALFCVLLNCSMGFYQVNMRTMTYGTQFLQETDDAYLRRHMEGNPQALLDSYPANCYINTNTDPGSCVLIIGDIQHVYLDRRHRYVYQSATTPYEPFKTCRGDHQALRRALRQNGITHILYNAAEFLRLQRMGIIAWKQEDIVLIEGFLESPYVRKLYINKGPVSDVMVYKLI